MDLIKQLKETYGYNEPIFTEEILSAWKEFSRTRVFQLLKSYEERGEIRKFDKGIYYISTQTFLGTPSRLSVRKVIEKKFIRVNGEVCGYYGGLSLLNALHLTTQMPNTLEVVTTKEATRLRRIELGGAKVILRKARTNIDSGNVSAIQLLDAFNEMGRPLEEEETEGVRKFVKTYDIKAKDIFKYAGCFPAKAIKNLLATGVENIFID